MLALVTCAGCGAVDWLSSDIALEINQVGDLSDADHPGDWTGWRGGLRGAVNDSRPLPTQWNSEHGIRWSVPLPGHGNSSPVVVGDMIFVSAELPGNSSSELMILCIDSRDGSTRWMVSAGEAAARSHHKNGLASATIAADATRLYCSFGAAGLFCLDHHGVHQWRADLGSLDHEWGSASSPVLFGNLVIQLADSLSDSHLSAFDKKSGTVVWRAARASRGCWATPVLAQMDSTDPNAWQVIVSGTGSDNGEPGFVIAYDPANGRELWRFRGTSDIACATAVVAGDLLISSSNNSLLAIRGGGTGNVTASHLVWRTSNGAYVPTGLAYRDRLYLITDGGIATCHDPQSGELIWRKRFRGTFSSSLVAGDGKVYAVSEQGDVQVFAAADEFQSLATNRFGERCLATPAISNGELFVRTETQLHCIGRVSSVVESDAASPAIATAVAPSPSDQAPADVRGTSQDDNL